MTVETNERLAIATNGVHALRPIAPVLSDGEDQAGLSYDLVEVASLMAMPKWKKAHDIDRMTSSAVSEDWVTWTVFSLMRNLAAETWWAHLIALARQDNPTIDLPIGWQQQPELVLWRSVATPADYEKASRARMRNSTNLRWVERSAVMKPVEGNSEIDISVHNGAMTVFVEAKLGSDISPDTMYDPERNQIARNVDCLIEQAGETEPMFWMLTRDAGAGRMYTQLLQEYRRNPGLLCKQLPHADPKAVRRVAGHMAIILWKDLIKILPEVMNTGDITNRVRRELLARVS